MPAYLLIRVAADDPIQLKPYQSVVPAIIEQYNGRFLARGGNTVTLEGPAETRRLVVIEFPTLDDAQAFYHSPEYTVARKLRDGLGSFEFVAIEGIG